uniref:Phlebovirus_G2 domain-containing protein n=1 Tax=Ascaris lumbricoides TaxID=6252 RepID=A0A0M3IEL1_ASCLU
MKAITRYSILAIFIFVIFFVFLLHHISLSSMNLCNDAPSYVTFNHLHSMATAASINEAKVPISKCSMASCFNMSMCLSRNHFRVYVYPDNNESTVSIVYANILKVKFYEFFIPQN